MTKTELRNKITELEKALKDCTDAKRSVFLMATINRYRHLLGKAAKYNF